MSILQNAVDSIAVGVEDYTSTDARRLVSCTRNIFSGILLLFKQKLVDLSPAGSDEVLIKQRVLPSHDPSGALVWVGDGRKTVDVQQIRERFDALGISVDWPRVERINRYRNDVEHYFSSMSRSSVRSLIADSFVVIRDFIRVHLAQDPLVLLGQTTWGVLTNEAEVYNREKQDCLTHIAAIDWTYSTLEESLTECHCEDCGSGLIDVSNSGTDRSDAQFRCLSCGKAWDFEAAAAQAVAEYFAGQNYRSVKDGDHPATIVCPECGNETYVLDDDCCLVCEASIERECQRCGGTIPPEELDGDGLCGYCTHMMSKDDDD